MRCSNPEISDRLIAWLDGALPADERERVQAHVRACEACRNDADLLRDVTARVSRAFARQRQAPLSGACPPSETLVDHAAGTAPPNRAAGIDLHLGQCDPCREIVDTLRALDAVDDTVPSTSHAMPSSLADAFRDHFPNAALAASATGGAVRPSVAGAPREVRRGWGVRRALAAVATLTVIVGVSLLLIQRPEMFGARPPTSDVVSAPAAAGAREEMARLERRPSLPLQGEAQPSTAETDGAQASDTAGSEVSRARVESEGASTNPYGSADPSYTAQAAPAPAAERVSKQSPSLNEKRTQGAAAASPPPPPVAASAASAPVRPQVVSAAPAPARSQIASAPSAPHTDSARPQTPPTVATPASRPQPLPRAVVAAPPTSAAPVASASRPAPPPSAPPAMPAPAPEAPGVAVALPAESRFPSKMAAGPADSVRPAPSGRTVASSAPHVVNVSAAPAGGAGAAEVPPMTVGNAQAGAGLSADKMEKRDAPSASEPLSSATRVRTTSAEGGDRASAGSEAFTGAPGAGGGAAGGSRLPLRPSQPQANAAGGLRSVASLLPRARDIVARVTLRTDLGVRLTVDSAGRVRVEVDLPQEDGDLAPALRRALTSGLPLDAQRGDTLVIVTP